MLIEITGDLFDGDYEAIGHGCNMQGFMGAGIAAQFRKRWEDMYQEYRLDCARAELGDVFTWHNDDNTDSRPMIFNMYTQILPGSNADAYAVALSMMKSIHVCQNYGIENIAVPRIGCGIGGLDWVTVRNIYDLIADIQSDVNITVVTLPSEA